MQGQVWVSSPPLIVLYNTKNIWFSVPTTSKDQVLALAQKQALGLGTRLCVHFALECTMFKIYFYQ